MKKGYYNRELPVEDTGRSDVERVDVNGKYGDKVGEERYGHACPGKTRAANHVYDARKIGL